MAPYKNVLFVSYDGMTDPLGQSQVIPYMQGLSKAGYNITILSCEKEHAFAERKKTVQQILDLAGISWVPIKYTKKPPVISSVYDLYKLKHAAKKIHQQKTIHLVHTRAGTPAMLGLWLKKKYGIKFLNDLRDFFADSRVDAGAWNQRSILYRSIYRYFKKEEAAQLKNSDGVVCLTHTAEKIIQKLSHFKENTPLRVIPCSVDINLFNEQNLNTETAGAFKKKLKIADTDVIISYLGSIGGWYLTAEMMQFFKQLLVSVPQAKFLFISPDSHEQILQTAMQFNITNDKIISVKGQRADIPTLLSMSHYSIFFIKPCYSKQASSPTKHGELMAMGIPVITNSGVGDIKTIVEKYNSGFVLDDFSEKSYSKIIDQMGSKTFDKVSIRNGAIDFYSLNDAITSYKWMYNEILNTNK